MIKIQSFSKEILVIHLDKNANIGIKDVWQKKLTSLINNTLTEDLVMFATANPTKYSFCESLKPVYSCKIGKSNFSINFPVHSDSEILRSIIYEEDFYLSYTLILIPPKSFNEVKSLDYARIFTVIENQSVFNDEFPSFEAIYMGNDGDSFYWTSIPQERFSKLSHVLKELDIE